MARGRQEQRAAYRQQREAEARRRTEELESRVASLQGLLAAGCRAPAFRAAMLTRSQRVEPFAPGPLAHPTPMPDPNHYQAQGGWGLGAGRRAQAQADARARFERDREAAQAAEARRQQQLAAYQREYQRRAEAQQAEVGRHNAAVSEMTAGLRDGDPDATVEYFSAALYASSAWPEDLPRQVSAAYDPAARQLVLNWELPRYGVVPEVKSVRYMPTADQDKETPRSAAQSRALYRDVLAQCVLLVLHALFAADEFGVLESVALNGFVDDHDPATGRRRGSSSPPSWLRVPSSRDCGWSRSTPSTVWWTGSGAVVGTPRPARGGTSGPPPRGHRQRRRHPRGARGRTRTGRT